MEGVFDESDDDEGVPYGCREDQEATEGGSEDGERFRSPHSDETSGRTHYDLMI